MSASVQKSTLPGKVDVSGRKNSISRDQPNSQINGEKFDEDMTSCTSSLCSFLEDKLKFIRESSLLHHEVELATSGQDSDNLKKEEECNSNPSTDKTSNCSGQRITVKSAAVAPNLRIKPDITPKLKRAFYRRVHERRNSNTTPRLSMSSDEAKDKTSTNNSVENKTSTLTSPHNSIATIATRPVEYLTTKLQQPSRESKAVMEQDIMKLYENGDPRLTLLAMNRLPANNQWAQVQSQVDAKVSNADHTSSYVLALANLFRKRVQVRHSEQV